MPPLKRYELKRNKGGDGWLLTDQEGVTVRTFPTKSAVTAGMLEGVIGEGTVRIHTADGRFQEERTFPRERDPRRHPG